MGGRTLNGFGLGWVVVIVHYADTLYFLNSFCITNRACLTNAPFYWTSAWLVALGVCND